MHFCVCLTSPQVDVWDKHGGWAVHPSGQQRQAGGGAAGGQQQRGAVEEPAGWIRAGDGSPQRPGEGACGGQRGVDYHSEGFTDVQLETKDLWYRCCNFKYLLLASTALTDC